MYFLLLGFHPVPVVGSLVQNRKETAQNEKQYTKQYKTTLNNTKTQNRKQKYITRIQT